MKNKFVLIYILFWLMMPCSEGFLFGQENYTYQKALQEEVGYGDIDKAVRLYGQVVNDQSASRELRANAQLHIGICYDKLGMKIAINAYQAVLDNFGDQKEIANEARKLMGRFIAISPYINPEAKKAYLMARNYASLSDPIKAVEYYELAIKIDSTFTAAYSGLAKSYAFSGRLGPPSERIEKAKILSEKALGIENNLAEAHSVLAIINLFYYWDWNKAERAFKMALAIKPYDAEILELYSRLLIVIGRFDEALIEIKKALLIDPVNPKINMALGDLYFYMRDYDQALSHYYRTLELNPASRITNIKISNIYFLQGREYDEVNALDRYFRAINSIELVDTFMNIYQSDGYRAAVNEWIKVWTSGTKGKGIQGPSLARTCMRINKYEEAIKWLQVGHETRDRDMILIGIIPEFDPLRSDPRFIELMEKVGLQ